MFKVLEWLQNGVASIFKKRIFVLIIVFCVMFSILVGRLFDLQIVNGQQYLDDYKLQIQKTRVLDGTRGNIYDRNGVLLAYNDLAYTVTIEDIYSDSSQKNDILNEEIQKIIEIVESHGDSVINDFGIILEDDTYRFANENETLRLRFVADIYGLTTIDKLTNAQKKQSAAEIINYLCTDSLYGYGIDQEAMDKESVLKLVTIRYAINLNRFQKFIPVTVASDVSDETMTAIMESMDQLPGVDILEDSIRRYNDSKYFANIIGYTGKISQEEYDALSTADKARYSLTDTVGKAGLEQYFDTYLQGVKGEVKLYVNSVGKVIEQTRTKEPSAGGDVYLTLDADLQKAAYDILEQELAGILLVKMQDVLDYNRALSEDAGTVIVASGDMYYQFIGNDIIDIRHFSDDKAKTAEKRIGKTFENYKAKVIDEIIETLQDDKAAKYKDLEREWQAYYSYVVNDVLLTDGILDQKSIDTSDTIYKKWKEDETINIRTYLNHAIYQNWIKVSKLSKYLDADSTYSDAAQVYAGLTAYVKDRLTESKSFDKLIYRYMIKAGTVKGQDIAMVLYEQGVLEYEEDQYKKLKAGTLKAYDFIRGKIETLEITPGQLGLEPCTGSVVITDPRSGDVLACVSYPGYDNNRLANTMDSAYYNHLVNDSSRPFYNNATQEKTAPGSTFKPLSAVAGLTEHAISPETIVTCTGIYENVEPNIKCWVYPDMHDSLEIVGAITNSCNVFFNELGFRLGLEEVSEDDEKRYDDEGNPIQRKFSNELGLSKLRKYAVLFGLDVTSGLEIPETDPQVSDQDVVRSAMGQGTNNYTTSQLARYISAVGNKGTVYDLTLVDRVEDLNGNVVLEKEPVVHSQIEEVSAETWNIVHEGMRGVVTNNDTVFANLNYAGISLAGKTGTAQQSKTHPDHALFVGFVPEEDPELAIAIRIANGYSSTFAAEVGAGIIEYRYQVRKPEEIITGTAKTVTVTTHAD